MAAILRWMFTLVLLIAVVGGGAAYWLYIRSDDVLRLSILQQLKSIAPTLKFDMARANCDWMGRIRIFDLTCALPDDQLDQPSLEVREVIVTLTDFENFDNFVVQKLYLIDPKVRVERNAEGVWNWQQASFQASTETPSIPEIEIKDAAITVRLQSANKTPKELRFKNFNVSAHPADSQRLSIQVATLLKPSGPLLMKIEAAIDGSSWKCKTSEPWRVPVDRKLVELLCDLSPEVSSQVSQVGQWMNNAKAMQTASEPIDASRLDRMKMQSQVEPISISTSTVPDFGVSCDCDLDFSFQKDEPEKPIAFGVCARIAKGVIHNGLLAFPLDEVAGTIYADNRNIIVKNLHATSGTTRISFDSEIVPSTPIKASMKVQGVEINDALKARLPDPLRRIVMSLGLTGLCDADATVVQEEGKWVPHVDLHISHGTVTHERFPVTVREVTGDLTLRNNIVEYTATGKYAGQPVESHGTITNPSKALSADITVKSNNLPLDDESLAACPPDVRKSIESLRLKGRHDVLLRVTRLAGEQSKYEPELNIRIRDASLSFTQFPYGVQRLQGFIRWKAGLVEFMKLTGVHDGATLAADGTFQIVPGKRRLDLTVDTSDAAFDRSLELALPPHLHLVWNNFQPQGNFDAQTKIAWIPGRPCEVRLPSVKVRDGEILMKCFPWSLQRLKGEFSFNADPKNEPGKLVIKDFHAHHDDTLMSGSGVGWFASDEPWQLKFTQLDVDNLLPNATFRDALPIGLQRVFDFLNPKGDFSFHGPAEFKELRRGDNSIGAAWKLRTVLSGCAINAGTRIDEIYGDVQLNGTWDGTNATLDGDLNLDSLSIFRQASRRAYQITGVRGPISFRDNKFVAGTETAIPPRKSNSPDSEKRIRGQAIDGTIFLDASVNVGNEPKYKAFIELQKGHLETYAQQYLGGREKLAGVMNGWMNLEGKGSDAERITGTGKLLVDHAALYDAPLFAQMFKMLQLQSPSKTLFDNATVNFDVGNGRFDLKQIELYGDTLSMRGRGYVRFDGVMQMDFGVQLSQWKLLRNGLTAIKVSGVVGAPETEMIPLPALDGALRQFFQAFNPRQMPPNSGLFDSLTGQNGDPPQRN